MFMLRILRPRPLPELRGSVTQSTRHRRDGQLRKELAILVLRPSPRSTRLGQEDEGKGSVRGSSRRNIDDAHGGGPRAMPRSIEVQCCCRELRETRANTKLSGSCREGWS